MKRYDLRIAGDTYTVAVESVGVREATVIVNGVRYAVTIARGPDSAAPPPAARPAFHAALSAPADAASGIVTAPLPGLVLDVPVAVGDAVAAGDVVVRMEAMKMENDLKAAVAGVVTEVHTKKGDEVAVGQVLVTIRTGCPSS